MDPEIQAMADISSALDGLEQDQAKRVLRWANERYQLKPSMTVTIPGASATPEVVAAQQGDFLDFPALFDVAKPGNGLERILACAYWLQAVQGSSDFDSQSINSELKNMGHPSANITRDMESLINRSPKLVIQTRKDGRSQQARKRFRLTTEGLREVQRMLGRAQQGGDD